MKAFIALGLTLFALQNTASAATSINDQAYKALLSQKAKLTAYDRDFNATPLREVLKFAFDAGKDSKVSASTDCQTDGVGYTCETLISQKGGLGEATTILTYNVDLIKGQAIVAESVRVNFAD